MARNETLQILSILRKTYPTFYRDISKEEAVEIADLWHSMLEGDDFPLVRDAIKFYIATDTKGYPPTVGLIKTKMWEIEQLKNILAEREKIS